MTLRWKFVDTETSDQYVFPINPNAMQPPPLQKQLVFGSLPKRHPGSITASAVRTSLPAQAWEFSGVSRTQAHHDALTAWCKRDAVVEVHDHLGRVFEAVFVSFLPEDLKSGVLAWRQQYTMKTLLLRWS